MRPNHILQKLRAGEPAFGIWNTTQSPHISRMLAMQGAVDWLLLDGEHSPIDTNTLALSCSAIADASQGRCTPLARVANGTIDQIKRALDSGAQGILVPLVNTPEQAADVVRFAKYPPDGVRGNGGMLPHLGFATNRIEYTRHANRETMVAIQIETREAVENIDAILAVPGIDCAFIGPNDLHISYGLTPTYWSDAPDFLAAIDRVLAACKRAGVIAGILCADAQQATARTAQGFTFVGFGSDVGLLLAAVGAGSSALTGRPIPPGGWAGAVRSDIQ
ncbi:MAG: aldolase/citrate lyase family protein [Chloroflexi bacterium]|nr:aldolase/citrate lyase family protein [Chloroflexota bacterium]